jgi:hypothetical protein
MTEIKLTKDIEDLRAIYYRDNNQKYFFGPNTKRQSIYLVIALIAFPFFAVYALNLKDSWLFILGTVFLSLLIYDFWKVAKPIIDWKKSVETFLKRAEKTKDVRLKYNEACFIHIQDNEELKQNWEVLEKAIINEKFIWLFSDINVLLPKNSMNEMEYHDLTELILKKVKNVEKNKLL